MKLIHLTAVNHTVTPYIYYIVVFSRSLYSNQFLYVSVQAQNFALKFQFDSHGIKEQTKRQTKWKFFLNENKKISGKKWITFSVTMRK